MDLSAYLLNGVVDATAPPNETEADARTRGDAIVDMVCAFDPRDAMETMIACHCVMLQFLLNAAMRDASNLNLDPAVLLKARAGTVSISRTLHQWVSQFEKAKKRNETRAAEARDIAQRPAVSVASEAVNAPAGKSPDAPVAPPPVLLTASEGKPVGHPPVPNGPPASKAMPFDDKVAIPPSKLAAIVHGSQPMSRGPAVSVAEGDRRRIA